MSNRSLAMMLSGKRLDERGAAVGLVEDRLISTSDQSKITVRPLSVEAQGQVQVQYVDMLAAERVEL